MRRVIASAIAATASRVRTVTGSLQTSDIGAARPRTGSGGEAFQDDTWAGVEAGGGGKASRRQVTRDSSIAARRGAGGAAGGEGRGAAGGGAAKSARTAVSRYDGAG